MTYYVETIGELRDAVNERRERGDEIRARLDEWVAGEYGIPDFSGVTRGYFERCVPLGEPLGMLARQVVTANTEGISFYLGCEKIGFASGAITFEEDKFSVNSLDKRAAVSIPWLACGKSGIPRVNNEKLLSGLNLQEADRMALTAIQTTKGMPLSEYHRGLRRQVFENGVPAADISLLLSLYHELADPASPTVYTTDPATGRVSKVSATDVRPGWYVRPPAHWYYPLYFSWFLDGTMVLFETYENPNGQVAEAKKIFVAAMEKIRAATGHYPLVARIPYLSPDMLWCNRACLAPGALDRLRYEVAQLNGSHHNIHDLFRAIADLVIALK